MEFKTETTVSATRAELWAILFDVERIAGMIPGCTDLEEKELHKEYSALITQKVGPFRFTMPSEVLVTEYIERERVAVKASGKDKKTRTEALVDLTLTLLEGESDNETRLRIDADIQISGKLATLGFPIVKKRCNEIFSQFEENLKASLESISEA